MGVSAIRARSSAVNRGHQDWPETGFIARLVAGLRSEGHSWIRWSWSEVPCPAPQRVTTTPCQTVATDDSLILHLDI
jgi:hypothetical protein